MQFDSSLRLGLDPSRPDVISVVGGGGKSSTVFRIGLDLAQAGKRAVITHTARIAAFQTQWAPAVVEAAGEHLPWAEIERALEKHGVCLLTGPVVGDRRAGIAPQQVDKLAQRGNEFGLHAISVEADGSKMRPAKAPAEHEPVLPDSTTLLAPVLGLDAIGAVIDQQLFHRAELVRSVLGLPAEGDQRFTPRQAAQLLVHINGGAKARPLSTCLLPIFNKADTPLRLLMGRLSARALAGQGQASLLTAVGDSEHDPVRERWGRVAVVILAAGAGRRMGRPKQVEAIGGIPMLLRALSTAAAVGGPVYVITGAHAELVNTLLHSLPPGISRQINGRLHVLHNPHWEVGQSSSLHLSVRNLPPETEAAIWMPADQPYLEARLLTQLAAAWRRGAGLVAPAVEGELRGAPALFDREYWPPLLKVEGDSGGRSILRRYAAEVTLIPTPSATLVDIDHPGDLT
jgi:molybdenum cofactor cytidylyltransferase